MRRFSSLVGMFALLILTVSAHAQTAAYTTIDGRITFAVPDGWTVYEEYASIFVTDTEEDNTLRGGLVSWDQFRGMDALYEKVTGDRLTADTMLQILANQLPDIRANMEAELGSTLGLPSATYEGPVEIAGYNGATGFLGRAPIYAFDVDGGTLLMSLNGEAVDEMVTVLETMLATLAVSPFRFDVATYTAPITAENVASLSLVTQYVLFSAVRDFALLPDGSAFVVVNRGEARLIDMVSGEVLRTYDFEGMRVNAIALSPDGTRLAAGNDLGAGGERLEVTIRLWDVSTGEELRTIVGEERGLVEEIGFSPDGSLLAVNAGLLLIYDATTGEPAAMLDRARDGFAFSPDGTLIAANCSQQNTVLCLYNLSRGEIVMQLVDAERIFPIRYQSVAFAPDGETLFVGFINIGLGAPADLTLWSVASGELIAVANGPESERGHTIHQKSVEWIAFSPDGSLIATVSDDDSLRLWDAATGSGIFVQSDAHSATINRVMFSPDGTLLFTASDDGNVRVWAVAPQP